jgi:hypothetical protein
VSAALRLASATLVAQHATLEASNRDLVVHEEEIARHNEQLRSQSEALEHQSEELRVANDDLASRERILARLLSLSRALASELSAEDVMATICEALAELIGEQAEASALLTREGGRMRARCHRGFGADGRRRAGAREAGRADDARGVDSTIGRRGAAAFDVTHVDRGSAAEVRSPSTRASARGTEEESWTF